MSDVICEVSEEKNVPTKRHEFLVTMMWQAFWNMIRTLDWKVENDEGTFLDTLIPIIQWAFTSASCECVFGITDLPENTREIRISNLSRNGTAFDDILIHRVRRWKWCYYRVFCWEDKSNIIYSGEHQKEGPTSDRINFALDPGDVRWDKIFSSEPLLLGDDVWVITGAWESEIVWTDLPWKDVESLSGSVRERVRVFSPASAKQTTYPKIERSIRDSLISWLRNDPAWQAALASMAPSIHKERLLLFIGPGPGAGKIAQIARDRGLKETTLWMSVAHALGNLLPVFYSKDMEITSEPWEKTGGSWGQVNEGPVKIPWDEKTGEVTRADTIVLNNENYHAIPDKSQKQKLMLWLSTTEGKETLRRLDPTNTHVSRFREYLGWKPVEDFVTEKWSITRSAVFLSVNIALNALLPHMPADWELAPESWDNAGSTQPLAVSRLKRRYTRRGVSWSPVSPPPEPQLPEKPQPRDYLFKMKGAPLLLSPGPITVRFWAAIYESAFTIADVNSWVDDITAWFAEQLNLTPSVRGDALGVVEFTGTKDGSSVVYRAQCIDENCIGLSLVS